MSAFPSWADAEMSARLAALRNQGEGQELEYMQFFPKQAHALAKEIAAFATTNDGIILLGVADDGELIGLLDVRTPKERDALIRRVEGICTESVSPSITPVISFATESDKTVMVVSVGKGPEPVYYSNCIPYLRHLSQSRPARPHEVIRFVADYIGVPAEQRGDPLLPLAELVTGAVLRIVETGLRHLDQRIVPKNFTMLAVDYKHSAQDLRAAAASDAGVTSEWGEDLLELSERAERVASLQAYLGSESTKEFGDAITSAITLATKVYEERVMPLTIPGASIDAAKADLRQYSRELSKLAEKLSRQDQNIRLGDLQQQFTHTGYQIQVRTWWGLHKESADIVRQLMEVGRELFRSEFIQTYMDGGVSRDALIAHMVRCATDLAAVTDQMEA